jgi:hypothetical protein
MTWQSVIETVQKFWLQFFLTGLSGAVVMLWKKINESRKDQKKAAQEQKQENEYMREAMRSLLKDRIFYVCNQHLKAGTITTSELAVITSMEQIYEKLGGNSVAKEVYDRMTKHCKIIIEENG